MVSHDLQQTNQHIFTCEIVFAVFNASMASLSNNSIAKPGLTAHSFVCGCMPCPDYILKSNNLHLASGASLPAQWQRLKSYIFKYWGMGIFGTHGATWDSAQYFGYAALVITHSNLFQ